MPVRYPLTVLAMGFSMDSSNTHHSQLEAWPLKILFFAPNDPFRVGPWFLPPSKEWQAIHPSEVYSFSPISRVGFLMTTFGSSDDTLSPAFGRISILKLPGFFDLFNLGIWRYKIQIFIGSGSEIKTESLSGRSGAHLNGN